jgi:hypothetical protein
VKSLLFVPVGSAVEARQIDVLGELVNTPIAIYRWTMKKTKIQTTRFVENWQTRLLQKLGMLPTRADYDNQIHWRDAAIVLPLFWSWVLLLLAIMIAVGSLVFDTIFSYEWAMYQRSGAVLVAAGSYVQFRMPNYEDWIHERILKATVDATASYDLFFARSLRFYTLSWSSIILGTFIWAYGDFLVT